MTTAKTPTPRFGNIKSVPRSFLLNRFETLKEALSSMQGPSITEDYLLALVKSVNRFLEDDYVQFQATINSTAIVDPEGNRYKNIYSKRNIDYYVSPDKESLCLNMFLTYVTVPEEFDPDQQYLDLTELCEARRTLIISQDPQKSIDAVEGGEVEVEFFKSLSECDQTLPLLEDTTKYISIDTHNNVLNETTTGDFEGLQYNTLKSVSLCKTNIQVSTYKHIGDVVDVNEFKQQLSMYPKSMTMLMTALLEETVALDTFYMLQIGHMEELNFKCFYLLGIIRDTGINADEIALMYNVELCVQELREDTH